MEEFILSLLKFTAFFICILYAYIKLLRLKLKVFDLLDIPLFIALSVVLHFVKIYIKILVPISILILGAVFLLLRFRKTVYETVTVNTIAFGISIVMFVLAIMIDYPVAMALYFIRYEIVKNIITQSSISLIQIICVFALFRIRRFQSGVDPKGETATFEGLLFFSVMCIFTMMLFYTKQSIYEFVLLVAVFCGLLFILWWRRHITYNYREAVKRQNAAHMEDKIQESEANLAKTNFQVAVYAKIFHYLNRAVPDCARLAESAAAETACEDACAVRDLLQRILSEMNLANEKCSLENIPQTGVKVLDAAIISIFTVAESKKLKVSVDIYADVESWFSEGKLDLNDIHILLAYLCDNATNAALGSPDAKVHVVFGATQNKEPFIRIYDSGKQFDEEVIAKLGKEQITTRAGVGGSGIGLFTVFEILQKYGASFLLNEVTEDFGYTKFIEIVFDGRRLITVRTCRESVAAACAGRRDISVDVIDAEVLRSGTDG